MNFATKSIRNGTGWALAALVFLSATQLLFAAATAETTTKRVAAERKSVDAVITDYLINFLLYVDWPESVPPAGEPWRIGLVKASEVSRIIKRKTAGKTVKDRLIEVVEANDLSSLKNCQMVFFSASADTAEIVAKDFSGHPVLTVALLGKNPVAPVAMIELVPLDRIIRYRLNPSLFKAQGLKPTSGLLDNALQPAAPVAQIP